MPTLVASGFDWDSGNWEKSQKHGVSIAEIEAVLRGDPQIAPAPTRSRAEERFIAVGRTPGGRALFIAFTFRTRNDGRLVRPTVLVICMPGRSGDMKRRVPRLTTDQEAEAFLDSDLSDLDFSQFKSGRLRLEEGPVVARKTHSPGSQADAHGSAGAGTQRMGAGTGGREGSAKVGDLVPSETYRLFEQAMLQRKQIVCMYNGERREVCPIILGLSQGEEKALTYQFGGESKSGLRRGGQWKCLWLSGVSDVQMRDGAWHAGSRHSQKQTCVEIVDLDINPDSPYNPKRRLSAASPAATGRTGRTPKRESAAGPASRGKARAHPARRK